eukprot:gene16283-3355_t
MGDVEAKANKVIDDVEGKVVIHLVVTIIVTAIVAALLCFFSYKFMKQFVKPVEHVTNIIDNWRKDPTYQAELKIQG